MKPTTNPLSDRAWLVLLMLIVCLPRVAIDAYLDALSVPEAQRVNRRINSWFTATERYPRQLHEMDRATYVQMKRAEYDRQQTAALN